MMKCRAWDGQKMIYDTIPYEKLEDGKILCIEKNGFNFGWQIETIIDCEAIDVMYCTGFKDMHGKEIYCRDRFKEGDSIGTIVYEDGSFFIRWDTPNPERYNGILKVHAECGEIIGNEWEGEKNEGN